MPQVRTSGDRQLLEYEYRRRRREIEPREPRFEVGDEIVALVARVVEGGQTKSEELGHCEFILTYKTFEPTEPGCLPHTAR